MPTPSRCTMIAQAICARRLRRGDMELVLLPQLSTQELDDLHYYTVGEDRLFAILPEAHALAALA